MPPDNFLPASFPRGADGSTTRLSASPLVCRRYFSARTTGKIRFSLRNLQYRNRQCLKRTSKKSFLLCQLLLSYLLSLLPKGRGRLPISALFLLHSRQESRKGERPISDGHAPPPPPLPACNSNRPIPASLLLLLPFLPFGGEVAGPYLSRTILHFHFPWPPQRSRQGKVASRFRSPPVPERGAYTFLQRARVNALSTVFGLETSFAAAAIHQNEKGLKNNFLLKYLRFKTGNNY